MVAIVHVLVTAGFLKCAISAIRAHRSFLSALWLAGTSALVALEMYLLGAPEAAVIESSVGAGVGDGIVRVGYQKPAT